MTLPRSMLLAFLLVCGAPLCLNAAEMRITNDGKLYVLGQLVQGDANRFKAALLASGDGVTEVELRSGGGSVQEGIEIGRLIRSLYLSTGAPGDLSVGRNTVISCSGDEAKLGMQVQCTCASACFLSWAGGIYKGGHGVYVHRISFERDFYAKSI